MKATKSSILGISVATALLFWLNDWIQQRIFHNGALPVTATASTVAVHAANNLALDWQMAAFVVVNVALFYAYAKVVGMARRGELDTPGLRFGAVGAPLVFAVPLVFLPPALSQDLYSYMAHGYLGVIPGGNPLLQPAYAIGDLPLGQALAQHGWHGRVAITPYGILWTRLEIAIMRESQENIALALVLFKATVVAAAAGCAGMIWLVLGRLRPALQLVGTLAFLWNPLVIVEIAGEGHNDAFMTFFVLAAMWACVAQRATLSLVAQAMGVIAKVVPLVFLPAQLTYLWRTRRSASRLLLEVVVAAALAVAIAGILYIPLWAGMHSFDGILNRAAPSNSASPVGAINFLLKHSPWAAKAGMLSFLAVAIPAVVFVLWTSLRVRNALDFTRACAWASLAYVLLASPDYWPWYAFLPVALLAMAEPVEKWWLILLMSAAGRFCGPLSVLYDHGFVNNVTARGATTGLGASLPLVVLLILALRRRRSPQPLT